MSRFSSLLNDINERLIVPQQVKARIILEIAADLEDAYEIYCDQGMSEAEATRTAQEKFILDDSTIAELSAIHQPFIKKWLDTVAINVESRWERTMLLLTLLVVAVLSGHAISQTSFFENSSIFVWPVLGVSILGIVLFFIKFYSLYFNKDSKSKTLRKGIDSLAYLGAFSIALGFTGYFYELFHYGVDTVYPGGSLITVICTVVDSHQQTLNISNCFLTSSSVMVASLLSTMFLALFWHLLANKAASIEMAKAASLLKN
jgi:hypothetical protein